MVGIFDCEKAIKYYPYIRIRQENRPQVSIESLRYDIPALESNLFSVQSISLWQVELGKDEVPVRDFCFYLEVDDSNASEDLFRILTTATEKKQLLVLGKRSSQGLNTFTLQGIDKAQELSANCEDVSIYLNTGMLLPKNVDFDRSTVQLFISERRPFEMAGAWDQNVQSSFISFLAEGSVVALYGSCQHGGMSIPSYYNPNRNIVFGNAFLYPLSKGVKTV